MKLRRLPTLLLLAGVLLLAVPSAAVYYTDWLWFREIGYQGVFIRTLNAQARLFGATFGVSFAFLYFNFRLARRALGRPQIVLGTTVDGRPIVLETSSLAKLALPIALVVALAVSLASANGWLMWLSFFNGVSFNERDVLFGRDVAFYVYRLPVFDAIRQHALLLSFLALGGSGVLYLLSGNFAMEPRFGVAFWPRFQLSRAARRHVALLAALIFGLLAWGAWLDIPRSLLQSADVGYGASYADVYARIPLLRITVAVLALGVVLALFHGFSKRSWPVPLAIAAYLIVTTGGGLYSSFVQRIVVKPNEQDREQPFIRYNIEATRKAYALDRVEERELSGDAELTPKDIADNASTIENVRLWDHEPLLQTFGQIQEIRPYYDFVSVDNDRYVIDGKYRQVMLSVREMNIASLQNPSWVNERLTFTHGYGLTLGPVNQLTTAGLPVLFIRDIPPVSTVPLPVTEPSIYFGEISSSYALVKTREPEFHYPQGDNNVTTSYQGSGGVPIGGFLRRLLFALRFGTTDILVTGQLTSESRIMFHRQIGERVRRLAPFLEFDPDPYPVLVDGRIFWIQDAYTTTANYPYATPTTTAAGGLNYIRNSVKLVIDAYHGTMSLYLAEPTDPIALTINKIFPGLLRPLGEMPAGLRAHVRYPEHIFSIQAQLYATYHMTNPLVFYNKEDQWQVPVLDSERNPTQVQPYYTIMRLPGEKDTEFIQMLPFTPRLKDNLSAWMAARSDGEHYGRLLVFQFPKQKVIFGPRQIVARINQDQKIAPEITLWNQQGSEVIQGTLLVIPIKESLLYVRPLYLRASNGRNPDLKRVIVAYQDRIVMGETLNQALIDIFGRGIEHALAPDRLESSATSVVPVTPAGTAAAAPVVDPTAQELAVQAKDIYARMIKAQQAGDWASYGEELRRLGDVITAMERIKK